MRDYAKVAPTFWTGKTGRSLRGDQETQLVALYLMSSPHSNMIGVYHCPALYIAHETGVSLEGALKGLARLSEGGFLTYDEDVELVWVHEMAAYQIGSSLKANDNRVIGIQKDFDGIPESPIKSGFHAKYKDVFHIKYAKPMKSPFKAPSKPLGSQEQEQEQEQDKKKGTPDGVPVVDESPTDSNPVPCPHAKIIDLWAQLMPELPLVVVWNAKDRANLKARWAWLLANKRKSGEPYFVDVVGGLEWFGKLFGYLRKSDFLMGRTGKFNGFTLKWLIKADNFAKCIEGNYHGTAES